MRLISVKNVFKEGEQVEDSVIRNFRIVRQEGNRQVRRAIDHYSLNDQGLTALTLLISFPRVTNSAQGTSTIKTPFPGDGGPFGSLNASGSASSGQLLLTMVGVSGSAKTSARYASRSASSLNSTQR